MLTLQTGVIGLYRGILDVYREKYSPVTFC